MLLVIKWLIPLSIQKLQREIFTDPLLEPRQEVLHKISYHPTYHAFMGHNVLDSTSEWGIDSPYKVSGQEIPSSFTAVILSGPPVVIIYPNSSGTAFSSDQLDFGTFGSLVLISLSVSRARGTNKLRYPEEQFYISGSVASLTCSNEGR